MLLSHWLFSLNLGTRRRRWNPPRRYRALPESYVAAIQTLEDRVLLSANFVVNTVDDTADANVGDGLAQDANGNTSLRAAIMEANALAGEDTITLGAGTYALTRAGGDENSAVTGDLDVTDDLILVGAGAANTIIDGNGLDRVFHIHAAATADFSDITVTGGAAHDGGGLATEIGSELTLEDVTVELNTAIDYGGGIVNQGTLSIIGGTIVENSAYEGGGLANVNGGQATVTGTLIVGNEAGKIGGGLLNDLSELTVNNSTLRENHANRNGGGIFNWAGTVNVTGSDFIENSAGRAGGGIENTGNTVYDPGLTDRVSPTSRPAPSPVTPPATRGAGSAANVTACWMSRGARLRPTPPCWGAGSARAVRLSTAGAM